MLILGGAPGRPRQTYAYTYIHPKPHTAHSMQHVGAPPPRAGSFSPNPQTAYPAPLSSEYGTYKTVKARFWPWFSGKDPLNLVSCSLFAPTPHSLCTPHRTPYAARRRAAAARGVVPYLLDSGSGYAVLGLGLNNQLIHLAFQLIHLAFPPDHSTSARRRRARIRSSPTPKPSGVVSGDTIWGYNPV